MLCLPIMISTISYGLAPLMARANTLILSPMTNVPSFAGLRDLGNAISFFALKTTLPSVCEFVKTPFPRSYMAFRLELSAEPILSLVCSHVDTPCDLRS